MTGPRVVADARQVLMWAIVFMIVLRISVPRIQIRITNNALLDGNKVRGSVTDVLLGLLTGTYSVRGFELRIRGDSGAWVPLRTIATIRCDLDWLPLQRGELISRSLITRPVLHVLAPLGNPTNAPTPPERTPPLGADPGANPPWQEPVQTAICARLTAVNIVDGKVKFTDARREITTAVTDIHAEVDDLIIPKPALTHRCPCRLNAHTPGNDFLQIDHDIVSSDN